MNYKSMCSRFLPLALLLSLSQMALATTWYVDGVHGSDANHCTASATACKTIGHAMSLAVSGDTIRVAAGTYTENLVIGTNLTIIGSNLQATIIDGGRANTVVTIASADAHVILSKVVITGGLSGRGGGIYNRGTLRIYNTTITGNTAYTFCETVCLVWGGGIGNFGTQIINNSTISGSTVQCTGYNCRLTRGGGIFSSGPLIINNSNIAGNNALADSGGSLGGGIGNFTSTNVTIQNSILANNSAGNCAFSITSKGCNLSSDDTCNFHNSGDRNNTNPMLGPPPQQRRPNPDDGAAPRKPCY